MKIHIPNLTLVKYIGEKERKLWEAKGVEKPLLKTGDGVLLSKIEATLLVRSKGRHFKVCENQKVNSGDFVNETNDENLTKIQDLIKVQKYNLTDEYMRGLCNGLICAESVFSDKDPDYIEPPEDENTQELKEQTPLKELSEFTDKDPLETYGKEFGIDLDKRKSLEDMYADLVAHTLKDVVVEDITEDEEQDVYMLPFVEDIDTLDLEAVKFACDHANITKGNKGIVKLKALLLPHLPKKV